MHVGIVGLGQMGRPMAANLLSAGYQVAVFDPVGTAVDELVGHGAKAAANPADVAGCSEVTVLMVRDAAQAETAVRGEAGFFAGAGEGNVLVVMSSLPPALVRDLGKDLCARNVSMLDAPVSGGVEGARSGTLTIMAAGSIDTLERCRPVLEVLGERVHHVGEAVGLGQTLKTLNQALYFTGLAASAEAVVMGAKAGLDPEVLVDVIAGSSGETGRWRTGPRWPGATRTRAAGPCPSPRRTWERLRNSRTSLGCLRS